MHLALRTPISRRTVIKGVGATIALPFLEAMFPRALRGQAPTSAAAAVDAAPLTAGVDGGPLVSAPGMNRMLLLYIPNGVHIPAWYPETEGADYTMSRTLAPLEAYRKDFSILNNLACLPATMD